MSSQGDPFPIAKVDYTTARELLPMLLGSQMLSSLDSAPDLQAIIAEEERKQGHRLSDEERRALEERIGFYRKGDYVVRQHGHYAVGLNLKGPVGRVILHKLGVTVACAVLAEIHLQQRTAGVVIPKRKFLAYLGYSSQEKQAYQDLRETLQGLRWLEYKLWLPSSEHFPKGGVGNFIYNLLETRKQYTLDVNERFVGCIAHLFNGTTHASKERKRLFERGYFDLVTKALPLSRRYPVHTRALLLYVLRERGNKYLNTAIHKVIAQRISMLVEETGLRHTRADVNYRSVIKAFETLISDQVVDRLEPSLEILKALQPKTGLNEQVRIYVRKPKELDRQLGARLGQLKKVIFPVQNIGAK